MDADTSHDENGAGTDSQSDSPDGEVSRWRLIQLINQLINACFSKFWGKPSDAQETMSYDESSHHSVHVYDDERKVPGSGGEGGQTDSNTRHGLRRRTTHTGTTGTPQSADDPVQGPTSADEQNKPVGLSFSQKAIIGSKVVDVGIDFIDFYRKPTLGNLYNLATDLVYTYSALYGANKLSVVGNFVSVAYAYHQGGVYGATQHAAASGAFMLLPLLSSSAASLFIFCVLYNTASKSKNLYDESFGTKYYTSKIESHQLWVDLIHQINKYKIPLIDKNVSDAYLASKIHEYNRQINATKKDLVQYNYQLCKSEAAELVTKYHETSIQELVSLRDETLANCDETFAKEMAIYTTDAGPVPVNGETEQTEEGY